MTSASADAVDFYEQGRRDAAALGLVLAAGEVTIVDAMSAGAVARRSDHETPASLRWVADQLEAQALDDPDEGSEQDHESLARLVQGLRRLADDRERISGAGR